MKKTSLVFAFIFSMSWGFSQTKIHYLEFEKVQALENLDFYCLNVVDKRADKSQIGLAYVGLGNIPAQVKFERNLEDELSDYFLKRTPFGESKTGLIFLIHQLEVWESQSTTFAYAGLEIEFILDDGKALKSLGIFENYCSNIAYDVTHGHERRIEQCIENCLLTLKDSDWINYLDSFPLYQENKYNYDIHNIPKSGVYSSFGQLSNNRPLQEEKIKMKMVKDNKNNEKYICENELDLRIKEKRYLSDGQHIYIFYGSDFNGVNRYIKAKHQGRYLYFEFKKSDNEYLLYQLSGLIGYALSYKVHQVVLDTKTGLYRELNDNLVYLLTKENSPEILKKYRESSRKKEDLENVIIELNKKFI